MIASDECTVNDVSRRTVPTNPYFDGRDAIIYKTIHCDPCDPVRLRVVESRFTRALFNVINNALLSSAVPRDDVFIPTRPRLKIPIAMAREETAEEKNALPACFVMHDL